MSHIDDSEYHTANDSEDDETGIESLRKVIPANVEMMIRPAVNDNNISSERDENEKDIGHLSRKLQSSAFINDLQHGLSFSNALTRLQTMKALMEQLVSEAIDNNVETDDDFEDFVSHHRSLGENLHNHDTGVDEPKGITRVTTPKMIPMYNDVVIPQEKYPRTGDANENEEQWQQDVSDSEADDTSDEIILASLEPLTILSSHEKKDHKALRTRIRQINELNIGPRQRAVMMQKLMMGKYANDTNSVERADSRSKDPNFIEDDDYLTAISTVSDKDRQPVYQKPGVLGCPHYQRACKLQCASCSKWVPCRLCHDDLQHENTENPHLLERNKTRWIMCMRCQKVQRPSKTCEGCGEEFALYCCEKCKLYDNDEAKDIYHCDKCGICRLGLGLGIDFFHCDGCQACLSIELQDNHKCIERSTMSNCPICGEYMFTSVKPVVYMSPCGHAIHQHCFDEYTKHSYKCPQCQVTVLNMDAQFRVLDKEIEEQPLPEPYCDWMCIVSCNDCKGRSKCTYHILGLKCGHCLSYNTIQLKLIKPGNSEQEGNDLAALEQFSHSMNHSLSENLLRDHFQTENVSPIINMDNSMLSNFDQYMNEYFKEGNFGKSRESHHVNDFISTKGLFRQERMNHGDSFTEEVSSQSMNRGSSLTDRFKQFIGDSLPVQRSLSDVFQMWRQDSNEADQSVLESHMGEATHGVHENEGRR